MVQAGLEIGRINLETWEINLLADIHVQYSCSLSGDCCRRFYIPVTEYDIARIEDRGYEIYQISNDNAYLKVPKTEFGSLEKNYPIKRKPFNNECTFLEDGVCSIHEFKPFGCRIFPFQFRFNPDKTVSVVIHSSNFCPSVKSVQPNESQNLEFLEYLRDTLKEELEYREWYDTNFG